jgi:murein DD-endopeptidase MepM/ murein hydrolase activator NlpD
MGCEAGRKATMSGERRDTESEIEEALRALTSEALIEIRAAHVDTPRSGTAFARQTPSDGTALGSRDTPVEGTAIARPTAIACPTCKGPVDVKSRHIAVYEGAVRVYCSEECLNARDALPADAQTIQIALPPKRRRAWWWLAALFVPAGAAGYFAVLDSRESELVPPPPTVSTTQTPADPEPSAVADPQREADAKLVEELSHDAWIHPLAGPTRRMPSNHNGAFGAVRPGERPPECVSGHCGVDLGNVWGEPVHAVHEGVIDFVNRGPNEDRGGAFVRIAHRDGTLFSWYFHLAAVPKWIRPGLKVSAGTMIGLLGDTGIKHSSPHLHFALSVRTSKHVYERYLDPEPLIAIWPLWIPNEDRTGGKLSTAEEPGLPVRANGPRRKQRRPAATEAPLADTASGTKPAAASPVATPAAAPMSAEPVGAAN